MRHNPNDDRIFTETLFFWASGIMVLCGNCVLILCQYAILAKKLHVSGNVEQPCSGVWLELLRLSQIIAKVMTQLLYSYNYRTITLVI